MLAPRTECQAEDTNEYTVCLYPLRTPEFQLGCVPCCDGTAGRDPSVVSLLPHRCLMDKAPSCCAREPADVFGMFHSLLRLQNVGKAAYESNPGQKW